MEEGTSASATPWSIDRSSVSQVVSQAASHLPAADQEAILRRDVEINGRALPAAVVPFGISNRKSQISNSEICPPQYFGGEIPSVARTCAGLGSG